MDNNRWQRQREMEYLTKMCDNSWPKDKREIHFIKAVSKHPNFCGKIYGMQQDICTTLVNCRKKIERNIARTGCECFDDLVECELYEAIHAMNIGMWGEAVEELYDLIALCDRMASYCMMRSEEDLGLTIPDSTEGKGNA